MAFLNVYFIILFIGARIIYYWVSWSNEIHPLNIRKHVPVSTSYNEISTITTLLKFRILPPLMSEVLSLVNTAQYSTVQYNTVKYSQVQQITAH